MSDLIQAQSEKDLAEVAELFREYAEWLAIEMSSCKIDKTISEFPGQYGPPDGCLLLARQEGGPAGCVALRRIDTDKCEMKRLHVRPAYRGRGIGKALAAEIIDEARRRGYREMRLDSIADRMQEAVSLYRSLGFREIPPYGDHPERCTLFMELDLRTAHRSSKAPNEC